MDFFKSKWGKWTDISVGAVKEHRYLLQVRRHKNGKVQFRAEKGFTPDQLRAIANHIEQTNKTQTK